MLDLNVYNSLAPKKGRLLITEPFLENEFFQRAVILLCEHNEEGTFGFVLNNYVDIELSEFEGMPEFDTKISKGGPVSTKNLYYIHTLGDALPGSIQITGKLYAGGDFEILKEMIASNQVAHNQIRFFLGYSGWVEKQLEGELKHNSWLVSDIKNIDDIMDVDYNSIWNDYMESMGGKYKAFAHFPKDASLN
ncbi:YqgE/AlgH family protein [Paracrocinitomix mangrovi]|uniref:YqgE/AlgH family protein n=1 Tax=Paracrocinitomix mangrovi TaxID=2862509 RepID=UPI001C8DE17C|nr:YqgE/AlgH family protein [Paracrocinitomix mangrovi]UKN02964.1 YqgE/AlgH family protein [Paracrocinitomix mangrovi]